MREFLQRGSAGVWQLTSAGCQANMKVVTSIYLTQDLDFVEFEDTGADTTADISKDFDLRAIINHYHLPYTS